jgi:4'-phosphopantetheinyl transferase
MTPVDDTLRYWLISLEAEPGAFEALSSLLDEEQHERAARIANPSRRAAWIIAWARARQHLGEYLDWPPRELRFVRDAWGKPRLTGAELHFNLSHSGAWCLLAASRRHSLGVDLERWREGLDFAGLARRCFSEREHEWWASLAEPERLPAFFRLWTCKEAFIKADGRGMRLGLSRCEFDLSDEPRLVAAPPDCGAPREWRIQFVPMAGGYSAALALRVPRPWAADAV